MWWPSTKPDPGGSSSVPDGNDQSEPPSSIATSNQTRPQSAQSSSGGGENTQQSSHSGGWGLSSLFSGNNNNPASASPLPSNEPTPTPTKQKSKAAADKEALYEREMRERRRRDDEDFKWFAENLRARRADGEELMEDDLRALELFDREDFKGRLSIDDLAELDGITRGRLQEVADEEEFEQLLDSRENGEEIDEDKLYFLELLLRLRGGEELTDQELEDVTVFEDQRQQDTADIEELNTLLDRQERGEQVDVHRIYELELYEQNRRGAELTSEELDDLTFFQLKRENDKLDLQEYEELLQLQSDGEVIDEDRLYTLTLLDKRRLDEDLTEDELLLLEDFDAQRTEEINDKVELNALLDLKDSGENVDEDRLYQLELLERSRSGEELTDEELDDLKLFESQRQEQKLLLKELELLLQLREDGDVVDESRLDSLLLFDRRRQNEELSESENRRLDRFLDKFRQTREELNDLLDRRDAGEEIDEERLYELELSERKRLGEVLTDDEMQDLELFAMGEDGGSSSVLSDHSNEESLDTNRFCSQLSEDDQVEFKSVLPVLEKEGLPPKLSFSDDAIFNDSLMTIVSVDDAGTYIVDLQNQQETRDSELKESTLEDAREKYQAKIQEEGLAEDDQLFFSIFQGLMKERTGEAAVKNKIQDQRLAEESIQQQRRKRRKVRAIDVEALASERSEEAQREIEQEATLIFSHKPRILGLDDTEHESPDAPSPGRKLIASNDGKGEGSNLQQVEKIASAHDGCNASIPGIQGGSDDQAEDKEESSSSRLISEKCQAKGLEREKLESQRVVAKRSIVEAEQLETKRMEAELLEQERLEAGRREVERLETERLEKERLESERLEKERLEFEKLEAERIQAENQKQARLEAERIEQEILEKEKAETDRLELLRIQKEAEEAARLEALRLQKEKEERAISLIQDHVRILYAKKIEKEAEEAARLEALRLQKEKEERAISVIQDHVRILYAKKIEKEAEEAARLEALRSQKEKEERAISVIQDHVRILYAKKVAAAATAIELKRQHASTTIQRILRGSLIRKHVKERKTFLRNISAATKIQAVVRGVISRKRARSLRSQADSWVSLKEKNICEDSESVVVQEPVLPKCDPLPGERATDSPNERELLLLLRREENGEVVNQERIYELELGIRDRRGEDLSPEEREDHSAFEARLSLELILKAFFREVVVQKSSEAIESHQHNQFVSLLKMKHRSQILSDRETFVLTKLLRENNSQKEQISVPLLITEPNHIGEEGPENPESGTEAKHEVEMELDVAANLVDPARETPSFESTGEISQALADEDELNELLDLQEAGEPVDEDRLYYLELLYRSRHGEELTSEELDDLTYLQRRGELDKLLLDEHDRMLFDQDDGIAVDEARLALLDMYARRAIGEDLTEDELDDLAKFEEDELLKLDTSEAPCEPANISVSPGASTNPVANEDDEEDDHVTATLDASIEQGGTSEENSTSTSVPNETQIVANDQALPPDLGTSDSGLNVSRTERSSSASVSETQNTQPGEEVESIGDEVEHRGVSSARLATKYGEPDVSNASPGTEISGNSSRELDDKELNDLLRRRDNGEEVDGDRLYELDLLHRFRSNEMLSPQEREDLANLQKRRSLEKTLYKEYIEMAEQQEKGERIDEDRFYLLDLFDRYIQGEELTEEEDQIVYQFEQDEEAKFGNTELFGHGEELRDRGTISPEEKRDKEATDAVDIFSDGMNLHSMELDQADLQDFYREKGIGETDSSGDSRDMEGELRALEAEISEIDKQILDTESRFHEEEAGIKDGLDKAVASYRQTDTTLKKLELEEQNFDQDMNRLQREKRQLLVSAEARIPELESEIAILKIKISSVKRQEEGYRLQAEQLMILIMKEEAELKLKSTKTAGSWGLFRNKEEEAKEEARRQDALAKLRDDKSEADKTLSNEESQREELEKQLAELQEQIEKSRMEIDDIDKFLETFSARKQSKFESLKRKKAESESTVEVQKEEMEKCQIEYDTIVSEHSNTIEQMKENRRQLLERAEKAGLSIKRKTAIQSPRKSKALANLIVSDPNDDSVYEETLVARAEMGEVLNDDESYEYELFEKRRRGDVLSEEETKDLEFLKGKRLSKGASLDVLRERKQEGEPVDEDLFYELELKERKSLGDILSDDEAFELELFERRDNGEPLNSDELATLQDLRRKRLEAKMDEEDLHKLLEMKEQGKEYDEELLRELSLFQKHRSGEPLSHFEQHELEKFRRRRQGQASNENISSIAESEKIRLVDSGKVEPFVSSAVQYSDTRELKPAAGMPSKRVSHGSKLAAHFDRQKKAREDRKTTRYGDDISLGTAEASKQVKREVPKKNLRARFSENTRGVRKSEHPWKGEIEERVRHIDFGDIKEEEENPTSEEKKSAIEDEDFFAVNNVIFERSIFNFNTDTKLNDSDEEMSISAAESIQPSLSTTLADQSIPEDPKEPSKEDEKTEGDKPPNKTDNPITSKNPKDDELQFDDAWEKIETDKNVVAQLSRKREERLRMKTKKQETPQETGGLEDVPRLFLFEGEKKKKKKKRKKKRSKRRKKEEKKLEFTLSKEFRKAMQDIFEDRPEEEYDRFFGEKMGETDRPNMQRRGSIDSSGGSLGDSSQSEKSEASEEMGDDYFKRLRERSVQQDVKEMLYDTKKQASFDEDSDNDSIESDASRREHFQRRGSGGAEISTRSLVPTGKIRKNKSGYANGPRVDPAEVYAKELEKQKSRKIFSVSDLKREMEDMNRGGTYGSFEVSQQGSSPVGAMMTPKTPKTPRNRAFVPATPMSNYSRKSLGGLSGPGVDTLDEMSPATGRAGGFGADNRSTSYRSETGLLSGLRKSVVGGGVGTLAPMVEEDEDEGGYTPSDRPAANNFGFGGGGGGGGFGLGYQEPLPVPEMNDEGGRKKGRLSLNVASLTKTPKKIFAGFKLPNRSKGAQIPGMANILDEDEDSSEGEQGLLR